MSSLDDIWSANIPEQVAGADVKYKIIANAGSYVNTFYGNYNVMLNPFEGTITSIQAIQGTVDDSPFAGQTVSTTGIVTATFGNDFFIQNGNEVRSGIYIYSSAVFPTLGDSVIVTGEVSEYYSLTEFAFPDDVFILTSNNPIPEPITINTGDLANEDYEGMLVQVNDLTVTYATFNFDDYGAWKVDDGTGECIIHNTEEGFEYPAELAEQIGSITGVCTFNYDEWKIDLRIEDDVQAGADMTGPVLTEIALIDETTIAIYFNEDVEIASAETISNYAIDNDALIIDAVRHPFQNSRVTLYVQSALNGNYTLTATNINDLLGNTTTESVGYFQYIGIHEGDKPKLNVYPNPTIGQLFLTGLQENKSIEIVNTLGEVVFKTQTINKEHHLNLSLQSGLYFIHYNNSSSPLIIAH